jgi:4-amino-4-deoxy-L-arabinose transferase-like glycosyltransferase
LTSETGSLPFPTAGRAAWWPIAIPCALATLVAVQAAIFVATTSATFDESVYLRLAEDAYQHHQFAGFAEFGVAPLPILLCYALPVLSRVSDYAQAILLARVSAVALVGAPLVIVAYLWLVREGGILAGVVGGLILAFSPTMIANVALATTDAAFVLFALLTLAALARYVERPSWSALAALVLASSLAFSAKYSGFALFAVIPIVLLIEDRTDRPLWLRVCTAGTTTLTMCVGALLIAWALHAFQLTPAPMLGVKRSRAPAVIAGFMFQIGHQSTGHTAFLFGTRREGGWWYYQLVALALKSTYVELVAFGVALYAFATQGRRPASLSVWRTAFAMFLGISFFARIATGIRYLLLLLPLSVMATVAYWAQWGRGNASRRMIVVMSAVAAVLVQADSAIGIAPRYLSYFNAFVGAPSEGYRYLSDSNVDWGQDLPALREVLARVRARHPLVSYFGTAPLESYGLRAWRWPFADPEECRNADWIAISATHLEGLYLDNDPFEAFRAIPPSERAAYSILLYDASRPDVQKALEVALERRPR